MIRAAALALAIVIAGGSSAAAQPTVVGEIVALRQQVAALTARVGDLETRLAATETKSTTLQNDLGLTIGRYDILLRYLLIQACYANSKLTSWGAVLAGLQPFPLGDIQCPPEGSRFYIPAFLGPNGPPIPPAQ